MSKLSLTKKYTTYPKYKDSEVEWLGEIPEDWQTEQSKRVFKELNVRGESGLELGSVTQDKGVVLRSESEFSVWNPQGETDGYKTIRDGEFVLSLRSFEGGVEYSTVDALVSPAYTVMKLSNEHSKRYFKWLLKSDNIISALQIHTRGIRQGKNISFQDFSIINLVLPPKEEQEKIARFLDEQTARIDETIAKKGRLIELLKEKRTATINHAVTKGLDPHAELVDSGIDWIGKIPKGWEVKKLKTLVSIFGRIGFRGYTTEDIVPAGEGAISLSPGNISDNKLSTDNSTYISLEKYEESPEIKVKAGDILFVKTGSTIGKVAYVDSVNEPTTINPQLVVMKRMKANPKFLAYSLYSKYFSFQNNLNTFGGSTPSLSQSKLGSYSVLVPSPHEQQKIVTYLDEKTDAIERVINSVMKSIVLLQEFKSSLISHAVTGKIKA